MTELDDITLLRYFEDDLPASKKREVEDAIAGNPDAQKKLEMLKSSSQILETAFGHLKDNLEPPQEIVDKIRASSIRSGGVGTLSRRLSQANWLSIAATLVIGVGTGSVATSFLITQPPTRIIVASNGNGTQDLVFRGGGQSKNDGPSRKMFGKEVIKVIFDGTPDGKKLEFEKPQGRIIIVQVRKTFQAKDGSVCRDAIASEATEEKSGRLGIMACKTSDKGWESANVFFRSLD